MSTLAELRAGELGYGVLEVESRFSVEENVAWSCGEGRLEALRLARTPTSRSGITGDTKPSTREQEHVTQLREIKGDCDIKGFEMQLDCETIRQEIKV